MADESAPGAKPRILLLDDRKEHNYVLLLASVVEVVHVESWEEFDQYLDDTDPFALAILRALTMTEARRKRSILTAATKLREVFGMKPIVTHCDAITFHDDFRRAGFSHVPRLPKEVEPLVASLLSIPYPPPVTLSTERPTLSTGFAEATAAARNRPKVPVTGRR